MTDSTTNCPTAEQLRAMIDGTLPEPDLLQTQVHVDQCPICQKLLESLVAGSESWDAAVGHLRQSGPPVDETVFSDAMRRMKEEDFVDSSGPNARAANPLDILTPSDKPGSIGKLGPYEVTQIVGQGGMGVVLRAYDPSLHRVVAVKVLAPYLAHNPQARKRFVREAQAIAAVTHDHVITIHAIDESEEQPKIVMQFVAGRSLQQKIDAEGSLDLKEILRIGMQTAAGLSAAHAQGLVHRDVKPSNILLENGVHRVKLTDFGLARAVDDASLTQSGVIAGTPQYMAPEQANGDIVDHRADLFSLGSVMYAMCVGHSPFRASTTMGVLKRVCHDPPRPIQELNSDIPIWLSNIIFKLLAKRPEDRFQTAREVAELLERRLALVQQPASGQKAATASQTDSFATTPLDRNVDPPPTRMSSKPPSIMPLPSTLLLVSTYVVFMIFVSLIGTPSPLEAITTLLVIWLVVKAIYSWKGHWFNSRRVDDFKEPPQISFPPATSFSSRLHRIEAGIKWIVNSIAVHWTSDDAGRSRSALSLGWGVAGIIDLFFAFLFLSSSQTRSMPRFPFIGLIIGLTLLCFLSLVVAHGILHQRNLGFVRFCVCLGLLPVSPGAFVRVPLALWTLFWLPSPSESNTWTTTEVGRVFGRFGNWTRRSFVTSVWVSIWSAGCGLLTFVVYLVYVVPYAPSVWRVSDMYHGRLKGSPQLLSEKEVSIQIIAQGVGPSKGLMLPVYEYRRQSVSIAINSGSQRSKVDLEMGDAIYEKSTFSEFTERQCTELFARHLKKSDGRYGENLYLALQRLRADGGIAPGALTTKVQPPKTYEDYFQRVVQLDISAPPGFIQINKLLSADLFESHGSEHVNCVCSPSAPFLVVSITAGIIIWLIGIWRIVSGRHFGRTHIAAPIAVPA